MGIFRKEYSLEEALEKLKKDNKNKLTTVAINQEDENTRYWVLNKNSLAVRKKIEEYKKEVVSHSQENVGSEIGDNTYTNRRKEFTNNISNNGKYQGIAYQTPKDYNNNQATNESRKSIGYNR